MLLWICAHAGAQTYPKYRTAKKDTVSVKNQKVAEVKAVAQKPLPDFDALMKKAFNEYRVKQFDEATQTYAEAFAISPDSMKFRVLHLRAYCYYAQHNYTKAIEDCTTAIEKTTVPDERSLNELYSLRSVAYKARQEPGDEERACADYKKARHTAYIRANTPFECP